MIGQKIIYLNSVDSTSNYAAKLLKEGLLSHGTAILAEDQTSGRGQRGSNWQVEAGKNLTFSFYLAHKNLPIHLQESLTHFCSLGIHSFLRDLGLEPSIKWPNDIVIGSAKIAGILIENQINSTSIKGSIIGFGINVNQEHYGDYNATSIKLQLGKEQVIMACLEMLCKHLNSYYSYIEREDYSSLKDLYLSHLWLRDTLSSFMREDGTVFEGIIKGTDTSGRLIIEIGGLPEVFELKSIQFIARNNRAIS